MLSCLRNSVYAKVLWGLQGLYLLNISVDAADPYPDNIPENLSRNDQESIIEIIVEQVLGFEDAIKEYDDCDAEDYTKKKNTKIEWSTLDFEQLNETLKFLPSGKSLLFSFDDKVASGFKIIDSPPPKV